MSFANNGPRLDTEGIHLVLSFGAELYYFGIRNRGGPTHLTTEASSNLKRWRGNLSGLGYALVSCSVLVVVALWSRTCGPWRISLLRWRLWSRHGSCANWRHIRPYLQFVWWRNETTSIYRNCILRTRVLLFPNIGALVVGHQIVRDRLPFPAPP
jgi:hypothetical protein